MKKYIVTMLSVIMISILTVGCTVSTIPADNNVENIGIQSEPLDYGALGAEKADNLTIEEMLRYAIEDEYLARQEYESIMDEFGEIRPFSNIIKAEEYHIELLSEIYKGYGFDIPEDLSKDHIIIPGSNEEAMQVGVTAEIKNIAMYEQFLENDLPNDIREVFEELRDASKNHLRAFERGSSRNGNVRGNGK